MSDQYKNDIDRIQKLIVSIKTDINKREQKKKAGQQFTIIEGEIRGQLTNLDRELVLLGDLIKLQEKNQMQKEQEKRRNQLQEFKNQRDIISEQFKKAVLETKQEQQVTSKQMAELSNMSNRELFKNQKDLQQEQEKLLDQTNEQAMALKYSGQNINHTINQQIIDLNKLNDDVDKTNKNMTFVNSKFASIIQKSSNCWLIIIIVVEVILLICFILFL
ncbi:unnamed protein product [Paramecium sonneborni]|uniref:t-SNARE coiled-coil homology domain-containing protein n=1 Tax=Paramecium sonneborni TaxID=65129 RepID=A0A8S1P8W0_9CILI|nr:unnamed protein product [Paramecium sonneborni]CAD8099639.1 unnamed protein product [Paramecium sonneborni]